MRNGTRQNPDNIRSRILAPIRDRANRQLEAEGRLPIAHMMAAHAAPHVRVDPRRCDVPPRRAMYLMGHTAGFRNESGTELPESLIVCVVLRRSSPHEIWDFGQAAEGTRTLDLLHGKRNCLGS
jgi:hypothetical protein